MTNNLTDTQILKELNLRLSKLLEEEKVATKEKEIRDVSIQKTKMAIEAFSNSVTPEEVIPEKLGTTTIETEFEYPKDKTWQDKIKAFMKFKNKGVTVAQIVEGLKPYEPEYSQEKLYGAISNIVSTMVKKDIVKIYKPPVKMKGYFYGNPLWFEGEDLKQEYVPDFKEKLLW